MQSWSINHTAAVAEDFGDEVIVLHPGIGAFFSLRGRAADLWRGWESGASIGATEAAISTLMAEEAGLLQEMTATFQDADILLTTDSVDEVVLTLGDTPAQYTRNDEFDELIRLDPIHDVDERGWPFRH